MPTSVAAAVVGSVVSSAFAEYAVFELGMGFIGSQIMGGVASFAASSLVGSALRGGADESPTGSPSFTTQAEARTHVIRSAVANRRIIYGRAKVSGPLVFAESSVSNDVIYLVVALAGHEIDAVEEIYFNDQAVGARDGYGLVTAGLYAGRVRIVEHLGAADQAADTMLTDQTTAWTESHRLAGVAYLAIKLVYDRDVFPRGIPNIKALVRGKKLYDPRDDSTAWSTNLALAVRDYLAGDYGLASTSAEIDDTALAAAANICDEAVTLAAGGSEARYTVNAVLDTGSTPRANMEALLSGCGGALTWPAGRWTLHVGAYEAPVLSLDEDDLAGPVQVRARVPRQDLYNGIKGTFVDPDQDWQPTDFPAVTNSTYATQDGAQIFRDVAFPVTTSSATAQRLAKMIVEKSRQGITVQAPFKLAAFKAAAWDNIELSLASLGWTEKVFKVTQWQFNEAGSVNLTLQEEASACYDWSAEETLADPAPDTTLPDPLTVAAPGTPAVTETLYETTGSAGVKARATIAWTRGDDAYIIDDLPEYRVQGGEWIVRPAVTSSQDTLDDLAPGFYEFRVRSRNGLGVRSEYSGTRTHEILGLTAPPADVTGFSVIASAGRALARWTLHPDLDVRQGGRIVIRHSVAGTTWEEGVDVGEFPGAALDGPLPLLTGTYLARAQDSSGNWAAGAASFAASEAMVTGWTTVATATEHTTFSGTKTDLAVVGSALQLDSATPIDSMTDLIDDWSSLDTIGGLNATGSYAFAATMDLATVAVRNFLVEIEALSFDAGDLVDARTTEVDYWDDVDGDAVADCTVTPYIRTTPDNPAGSPTWSEWAPFFNLEAECRAAQFRLDFASGNRAHNIAVSALTVRAREPA